MVIRKPFKVLVCLLLVGIVFTIGHGSGLAQTGRINTGVEADALSADIELKPPARSGNPVYRPVSRPIVKVSRYTSCPPTMATCGAYSPRRMSLVPPIVPSIWGMFSLPGFPFLPLSCNTVLPRPGCKQFLFKASLWYAVLQNTNVVWGTDPGTGLPGTEIDLHDDLELSYHRYIPEYEGRYQLRPTWGLRYSYMPISYEDRSIVETVGGFTFGGVDFAENESILAKWDRKIHSFDLVYSWFNTSWAQSSIYAGYHLYDDRLAVSDKTTGVMAIRSKGFGLASAGLGIDKVISVVGTGGGTASIHCKWTCQFLEDYFGWDGEAMMRLSVPMNCGRWGFLEAGWRWMRLEKGKPTDTDKVGLHGIMISAGVIF